LNRTQTRCCQRGSHQSPPPLLDPLDALLDAMDDPLVELLLLIPPTLVLLPEPLLSVEELPSTLLLESWELLDDDDETGADDAPKEDDCPAWLVAPAELLGVMLPASAPAVRPSRQRPSKQLRPSPQSLSTLHRRTHALPSRTSSSWHCTHPAAASATVHATARPIQRHMCVFPTPTR